MTVHFSSDEVWKTVTVFSRMEPELARQGYQLGKDTRDWKVTLAQKDLLGSGPIRERITPILYRPFDVRYTYYTGHSRGFICMPRPEVMRHMLAGENLALVTPKQHKDEFGALATDIIGAHKSVATYDINYYFPLYLYPNHHTGLFTHHGAREHRPNLNPKLVTALEDAYGEDLSPEAVFYYVYSVLYAETYREKYAEFLRADFPRVPFTADPRLFARLVALGKRLADLHLLRSSELDPPVCRFEGTGDNHVAKRKRQGLGYEAPKQRVYINKTQYFAPVQPDIWAYRVGGYQVCEKWLKDRVDKQLDLDDIRTYCRIVTALTCTIAIQTEIDDLYRAVENNVVEMP